MLKDKPWVESYPEQLKNYELDTSVFPDTTEQYLLQDINQHIDNTAFSVVLPVGLSQGLTFGEVDRYSSLLASYFVHHENLKCGDVVAIQMPNGLNYPIAVLAAWKAGLIVTNVNPLYTARELELQLKDSEAKLLIACDLFLENVEKVVKSTGIRLMISSVSDHFEEGIAKIIDENVANSIPYGITPSVDYVHFMQALKKGEEQELGEVEKHSVAVYQYTGGTTGASKGAVISHGNLLSVLKMGEDYFSSFGVDTGADDIILTVIPMYHIFAFTLNFMLFFKVGGHNVLIPRPNPVENLKPAFENFKITWMTGVETLYASLLKEEWFKEMDLSLKYAIAGGTALRPTTAQQWESEICNIFQGYGLTETSCMVAVQPPLGNRQHGTVGLPLPGSMVKVVDDQGQEVDRGQAGELLVYGPHVIREYLNRPAETEKAIVDGWFYTGDVVAMDNSGHISIVDRKKDVILVSGFNVYPNELENVISEIPDVQEVAVIGVQDSKSGEVPVGYVVRQSTSLSEDEVLRHCRENLTAYKVPSRIEFCDELPKSAVGKVLRREVRESQD